MWMLEIPTAFSYILWCWLHTRDHRQSPLACRSLRRHTSDPGPSADSALLPSTACFRPTHAKVEQPASNQGETVEQLVRLHGDLGQRLTSVLPSKRADIGERMDNELFAQQLRAGAYGSEQLGPLIEYTWALLRMACTPSMNAQVQASYRQVVASLVLGASVSDMALLYFNEAHDQLDKIIKRIQKMRKDQLLHEHGGGAPM